MTEQEKIDNDIQMKLALQDAKVNVFMQEMSDFKEEMRDFKTEMRNRDNQRQEDMRDRDNQRQEDMREIRASIDSITKHVQNISTAAMIGVGASVIAVVVFVGTMVYTLVTR